MELHLSEISWLCRQKQVNRGHLHLGKIYHWWGAPIFIYFNEHVTLLRNNHRILQNLYTSMHVSSVAKSCSTLLQPHGLQPTRLLCPWDFPGKNTGVGCHFLFQGIFLTCVSCIGRWILYHWATKEPHIYYIGRDHLIPGQNIRF